MLPQLFGEIKRLNINFFFSCRSIDHKITVKKKQIPTSCRAIPGCIWQRLQGQERALRPCPWPGQHPRAAGCPGFLSGWRCHREGPASPGLPARLWSKGQAPGSREKGSVSSETPGCCAKGALMGGGRRALVVPSLSRAFLLCPRGPSSWLEARANPCLTQRRGPIASVFKMGKTQTWGSRRKH